MKKEHIVIAVPTMDWKAPLPLSAMMNELERVGLEDPTVPFRFSRVSVQGHFPVWYARNRLVQMALEDKTVSRMWCWDSDVIPPPDAASLLHVDADIVAGTYPTWGTGDMGRDPKITFAAYMRNKEERGYITLDLPEGDKVFSVDAALTGCMLIKRHVLEDPKMCYSRKYIDIMDGKEKFLSLDEPPPIFKAHHLPNGRYMLSEDLDFCRKAKDLGYSIKVHAGVRCGHLKTVDLMDVHHFQRRAAEIVRQMRKEVPSLVA